MITYHDVVKWVDSLFIDRLLRLPTIDDEINPDLYVGIVYKDGFVCHRRTDNRYLKDYWLENIEPFNGVDWVVDINSATIFETEDRAIEYGKLSE